MVVAGINIVSSLAEDISKPAVVQSNYSYDITLPCVYAPGLTVGDRRRELECCNQAVDHYNKWWTMGEAYLTRLLENLQGWNCPQFQYECANRTRAFTPFAKLAYARFCNQSELLDRCQDIISTPENIAMLRSTNSSSLEMWVQLAKNMSMDNYEDPCVQIALYERGGYSDYQETVEPIIPFCDMAMCGFDLATLTENNFNTWSCMPASCRANIIIA
uniref:Uncharacterized protein n=1 Tax=Ciona savignyi TaxID=51511 RepID=H2ZK61_CIOSA